MRRMLTELIGCLLRLLRCVGDSEGRGGDAILLSSHLQRLVLVQVKAAALLSHKQLRAAAAADKRSGTERAT